MDLQKRRTFIISFFYFAIIGALCCLLLKQLVPMLMPFIIAMALAAVLDPAVTFVEHRTRIGRNLAAAMVLLAFYGCLSGFMVLSGSHVIALVQEQAQKLPAFCSQVAGPGLARFFHLLETSFPGHSIHISSLGTSLSHALESASGALSTSLFGWGASVLSGFPTALVDLLVTVIATFFLTGSYRQVKAFLLRQIPESRRSMILTILTSARQVTGRLLKAYALLMALTFVQLFIGFWVLGVPMGLTAACLVTLVDILPVLGTGTVLLPWALTAWVTGPKSLGFGLLCLYLFITVVRQTLEPKVIGLQTGLSPAAALLCIFAGGKLLGLPGIFLFPIGATVLVELNNAGIIHILK